MQTVGLGTLTDMGQTRTDSNQQRAAKQRVANSRRCPKCNRGSAIQRDTLDGGDHLVLVSRCRWCDYESSTTHHFTHSSPKTPA